MLPLIQEEVLGQGWMGMEDLVNFVAVSESTPGPLAVNLSTYIGAETAGFWGAVCATFGVVLPSFVIILIVARCFAAFQENGIVKGCMNGLRPAVVGMIAASLLSVAGTALTLEAGWPALAAGAVLLLAALIASWKNIHPILIILGSAAVGIALGYAGLLG